MRYITGSRRLMFGERRSILRAQGARAVGKLAGAHPAEQIEILLDGAIAIGRFLSGLRGQAAAHLGDLLGRQIVDKRLALLDELLGPLIKLIEILRGVVHAVPLEAEPAHVVLNGVDVLAALP